MASQRSRFLYLPLLGLSLLALAVAGISLSTGAAAGAPPPSVPNDGTEPLPPGTTIETLLPGMNQPIAMAFDLAGRLFYTERNTGKVRLFQNGVLQSSAVITFSVATESERGLLGIAIDPAFNTNHYIYVFYSCGTAQGCPSQQNRVVRFVENAGVGSNPQVIFFSSDDNTCANHDGGNIHFGPDGKLFVSLGDDGCTPANSQDVTVTQGKIHRINPDGTIPPGNPVFTQTGALPSLYVLGLRNSFDFAFDPYAPGRIYASENGPGCDDELNRIEAGYNYGWRASYPCDDANPSPTFNTIPPLWYLGAGSPSGGCCLAPTGVEVYDGTQIPQWAGGVFMATFNNSALRHFYLNADRTLATTVNIVQGVSVGTDIETGPDGALWYIEGGGYFAGTLKRVIGPGSSPTPSPSPTATSTLTPLPPTATLTAVPPSSTSTSTATTMATGTATPTATMFAPTSTSTITPVGSTSTSTRTVTATSTATIIPATNTATIIPATNTAAPTATASATATLAATSTPVCPGPPAPVRIENFAYSPRNLTVAVGATVQWTNYDLDYHTATSCTESGKNCTPNSVFDTGRIDQNQSRSLTFTQPGVYQYLCLPHPYMRGTITVVAGGGCPTITTVPATGTATRTATGTSVATNTSTPGTTATSTVTPAPTGSVTAQATTTSTSTRTAVTSTSTSTRTVTTTATRTGTAIAPSSTVAPPTVTATRTGTAIVVPSITVAPPTVTATRTTSILPPTVTATRTATAVVPSITVASPTIIATMTSTRTGTATAIVVLPTLTGTPAVGTSTTTATRTVLITSTATTPGATSPALTSTATRTSTAQATGTVQATGTAQVTATVCPVQFSDVPTTNTFYSFVRCLACKGILGGYSDGTFRPNNQITRGQLSKIVSNSANFGEDAGPQIYEDVPSTQTFYVWVNRLSMRGYMGGYPCGQSSFEPCLAGNRPYFRPQANATRGQISKIVSNAAGFSEPVSGQFFSDIPSSNPFYEWIQRLAANRGIMGGYPCGGVNPQTGAPEPCDGENRPYFRWANDSTRGQTAKIVAGAFFPNCSTP